MVLDSIYTDPEALRNKYRNPKGILDALAEATAPPTQPQIINPTINPQPSEIPLPSPPPRCPAWSEFVWMRSADLLPTPRRAGDLTINDYLYNPVTQQFNKIIHLELGKEECVKFLLYDDTEAVFSVSHPVLRSALDKTGTRADHWREGELCLAAKMFVPATGRIKKIIPVGLQEVVAISLESEFIFASGTQKHKMIVGHNKAAPTPDLPPTV